MTVNFHIFRQSGMVDYGGPGSGNFGHAGRKGKLGGSTPKSGRGAAMSIEKGRTAAERQAAAKNSELSQQEKDTIQNYYTGDSGGLNSALRFGNDLSVGQKEAVKALDRLIDSSEPFASDTTLYRAIDREYLPKFQVGTTYTDKAYMSTSRTLTGHNRVRDDMVDMDMDPVTVQVRMPKGAKAGNLYSDQIKNDYFGYQEEMLLPRGSRFRVVSASDKQVVLDWLDKKINTNLNVLERSGFVDYLEGRGKGNWGHAGRKDKVGGSAPRKTRAQMTPEEKAADIKRCTDEKWARVAEFAGDYKSIMDQVNNDFNVSEEAKVLYLINKSGFRVGGKQRGAEVVYGASTLLSKQVKVNGPDVSFDFLGKSAVQQSHTINDPKIAAMIQLKQRGVGPDDRLFNTNSGKVRKYLQKTAGKEYLTKDLRTHFATSSATKMVKLMPKPKNIAEAKKMRMEVCKKVSERLGNTPTMAKNSYINPIVWKDWGL